MTLLNKFEFPLTSALQASNSNTVTTDAIFALGKTASTFAGHLQCGNLSLTGTLALDVYTGLESSTSTAWEYLGAVSLTASSSRGLAFPLSTKPLLPYARLKVSNKAAGAGATVFENVIAKLLTD